MRKLTKTVSALLTAVMLMGIVLCAPFTVSAAETFTSGDYEYEIVSDSFVLDIPRGTAMITGYTGNMSDLSIPDQIDGYSVSCIGFDAFKNCNTIINLTIPDSVIVILIDAFFGCENLKNVYIKGENLNHIFNGAFAKCKNLEKINIPNSVCYLDGVAMYGYGVFQECISLTEITLPNNLKEIDCYNFSGCTSLTSITIPDSVTAIGDRAFENCTSLKNITIPHGVTEIGDSAFSDCTSLESITLPNSLKSIGSSAFCYCKNLTTIVIPDSVTEIGDSAFWGCTNLANISISNDVKNIGSYAFYDTAWYNNQPDGLLYINNIAYEYKGEMPENTTIVLEEGTVSISNFAFRNCKNLTGITLPVGIKNIGNNAFFFCSNLKDIIIPEGVESIGIRAFQGCDGIKNLSFPQSLTNIDWCAFNSCDGLEEVILPKSIKTLGSGAFAECANLKKVIIPSTLEVIEEGVFYKCENLEEVIISEGVKTIKEPQRAEGYADPSLANGAFCGCTNLKVITIPKSITFIGEVAFDKYNETKVKICGYKGSAAENYAIENGFDFVTINDYTDVDSQIIVTAGTDAELKVEEITNTDEIEKVNFMLEKEKVEILYDISFVKDGTTVQPDGTVTVKIPCTNENSKVYRVETDDTLTDMNAVYDNGYMVFTTKHFSLYALVVPNDNVIGDVNGDGAINAKDRMTLTRYLAKWSGYENIDMTAADVNNDDAVNAKDRMILTRHLAKWQGYETLPLN